MINKVKVEICGNSYSIATVEREDYLQSLAKELNTNLSQLLRDGPKLSLNDALVLCALNYIDSYKKSEAASDNMRAQLTDYLEDAARTRIDLEEAKREVERLRRQLGATNQQNPT